MKEIFQHFWSYGSLTWARYFLDYWIWRALRSRIEPMMRVARMLRAHPPLPVGQHTITLDETIFIPEYDFTLEFHNTWNVTVKASK